MYVRNNFKRASHRRDKAWLHEQWTPVTHYKSVLLLYKKLEFHGTKKLQERVNDRKYYYGYQQLTNGSFGHQLGDALKIFRIQ